MMVQPSESPWSSPVLIVPKKNGKMRMCVDFRKVNALCKKNAYPIPFIHDILNQLKDAVWVSSIDLISGYHQILMHPDSRKYTAFTVPHRGLYEYLVMPFGLSDAPATFQALMEKILQPYLNKICFVYLDDILVIGKTYEEHLHNLKLVFEALFKAGLKVSWEKSQFLKNTVEYLGFIVGQGKIAPSPDKIQAMLNFPPPTNLKQVRSFVGLCGWYRRLIPNYAQLTSPLTSLNKKGKKFEWGPQQIEAFETLKKILSTHPIVYCPDFDEPFIIASDASDVGIGSVLYQVLDNHERVIAYYSRKLSPAEQNWTVTERECLAALESMEQYRPYIEFTPFTLITDHSALTWLMKLDRPAGRLGRWITKLSQYQVTFVHRKGSLMNVPDALSRIPYNEMTTPDDQPAPDSTIDLDPPDISAVEIPVPSRPDFSQTSDEDYAKLRSNILARPDAYPLFKVSDNIVYKLVQNYESKVSEWKIYVPRDFREKLMEQMHDAPESGHLGAQRTLLRIRSLYYWPHQTTDVKYYVYTCLLCQQFKSSNKAPAGPMQSFISPMKPRSAWSMDLIGPLPMTKIRRNRFILVFVDLCTR